MKRIALYSILIIIMLCSSCKSTKDLQFVHDTVYQNHTEYVKQYVYDSVDRFVYINQYVDGDTNFKVIERNINHYFYIHDTVVKTDTVYKDRVEYRDKEVVKEVNKYPLWPYVVFIIAFIVIRLYLKFKF